MPSLAHTPFFRNPLQKRITVYKSKYDGSKNDCTRHIIYTVLLQRQRAHTDQHSQHSGHTAKQPSVLRSSEILEFRTATATPIEL